MSPPLFLPLEKLRSRLESKDFEIQGKNFKAYCNSLAYVLWTLIISSRA